MSTLNILSSTSFPYFFGLAVVAPLAVPVVFGAQWLPSIILIQILCVVGLLRSTGNPVGSLLLAKGRADWGFKWNLALMITQVPGVYAGAVIGGAVGVAVALAILQTIYSVFNYTILVRSLLGPCLKEYVESMWPAFWISCCVALLVFGLAEIVIWDIAIKLVVSVTLGMVAYGLLMFLLRRKFVHELKTMLLNKSG